MSKDKHKGVARREHLLEMARTGGLYVNSKWTRQTHNDPDLRRLLKRGELVLRREPAGGRKRQTVAMVP